MPDMLVRLYELPEVDPAAEASAAIVVRRPMTYEKSMVAGWVSEHFSREWADECEASFAHQPVSCFIAVVNNEIAGFACYDVTFRDFFGPTGVDESFRGRGIGKYLLLHSLHAMRDQGYAYAVIGGVGPAEFYSAAAGAFLIQGSVPGAYPSPLNGK